jgi:hypothetical protein
VSRFGKTEEDFASVDDYNDYLQKREDISAWRWHGRLALHDWLTYLGRSCCEPPVYVLANQRTESEAEVKRRLKELEEEQKANQASIAMYKARRVRWAASLPHRP